MAEITLPPATRIRVITRALDILAQFKKEMNALIDNGSTELSDDIKTMKRKNAEEEGKLRRKLAKLKKEVSNQTGVSSKTDEVLDIFKTELSKAMPDLNVIGTNDPLVQNDDVKVIRTEPNRLHVEIIVHYDDDRDIGETLSDEIFGIEGEVSPTLTHFFTPCVAKPLWTPPDDMKSYAFEVEITS